MGSDPSMDNSVTAPPTPLTRSGRRSAPRHRRQVARKFDPRARWQIVAGAALLAQFVWLVVNSARLYGHFSLTSDFALFSQAWHLVTWGHPFPTTTVYRTGPFLGNHFELLLYPLALLREIDSSGFLLLVLQDLVTVGAELVAFLWALELINSRWEGQGRHLMTGGLLVVLFADPWIWWASAFDFHLQAFAAFFSILAARHIWNRRWRPAVAWTALTLCCGSVESVCLIGLGIGLVFARRDLWRQGLALAGVTLAWLLGLNAAGYDNGSQLSNLYGYLTDSAPGATVHVSQVIFGVLRHPHRVLSMVNSKRTYLWHILAGPGLIGVASWIGLPIAAVLLVPALLNAQLSVVQPEAAFQVLPLYVFLPIGAVLMLCWIASRGGRIRIGVWILSAAAVVETIGFAAVWIPRAEPYFDRTSGPAAAVLNGLLSKYSSSLEVVASNGFVGRFANRPYVYSYYLPTAARGRIPVRARIVEFILSPTQGLETTPPAVTRAAIGEIKHRLHAATLVEAHGIYAYFWIVPAGVHSISLPGG